LASLCGCSARHFNRLFRSCFGISVRARQTQLRLIKARQLLSETEKKVLEIALDSGYRNLSLFNLLFKRQFGMTPSESRRRWKKDAGKLGMTLAVLAGLVSTPQGRPGFDLQFSDIQAGTVIETTSGCHASLFVFFPREAQASPESRNRFTRHDSPMENA